MPPLHYNGALTAEQYLLQEMRIAARLYLDGCSAADAAAEIRRGNLFQYPTEREVARMTRACYKRLDALASRPLVRELAAAPQEIARQINLYAMMCANRLVWEFMVDVIGGKFRACDLTLSKKDLHVFFDRLAAQDDTVAGWSAATVGKLKSVLVRALVETRYLDTVKSETLNPVFLCDELEQGIREKHDLAALPAFNCFWEGSR